MKTEDRDNIDDLFRSKLYDFEADALPDDVWDKIEGRLNKQPIMLPASTRWKWWSAAAAIALLILSGTVFILRDEPVDPLLVKEIEQKTDELKTGWEEQEYSITTTLSEPAKPVVAKVQTAKPSILTVESIPVMAIQEPVEQMEEPEILADADENGDQASQEAETKTFRSATIDETNELLSLEESMPVQKKEKIKRWNFGMGAGSLTTGTSSAANMYAFRNTEIENPQLDFLNSIVDKSAETPKTDIKHSQPISFGLSASYMLTPRWYLMAGVSYSYLLSEWKTNGVYSSKTKQRLHFVGVPVSLAYKIAEFNKFMWYASAGFKAEVNVAGNLQEFRYTNNQKMGEPLKYDVKMDEWYWSVNAGTGVSYPLWRYLNAFVEVGGSYYFDNGTTIQTIHSEKPFNVNLSVGLRLGF